MMKFVYNIFTIVALSALWFTFLGHSSGAAGNGNALTGAPFDNGTCANCHSGGTYGTVTPTIAVFEVGTSTAVTNYVGGRTYDVRLLISASSGTPQRYGFQLVAANASAVQAGSWSNFPSGTTGTSISNRTYVEQTTPQSVNNFTFRWTAPATSLGTVTFYAVGNCVNNNGGTGGDKAGAGSLALPAQSCTLGTPTATVTNASCPNTANGSVNLSVSGGTGALTFAWSNGATTQNLTNLVAGIYHVTVTDGAGCQAMATGITVTANTIPTATITPSSATTFCTGGSVTLMAAGGGTYAWSNGGNTASITVNATGNYTVTVTNGGCTATASRSVTVDAVPNATITPLGATTFCSGGSVTLTAAGGGTYAWSNGGNSASITVNTAGNYTVTVTNGTCTATASRAVTVDPLPNATITPIGLLTFCQGDSVLLGASGGGTYAWSNNTNLASINVKTSGTYTVTVTSSAGCTATASRTVTVNPNPVVTVTATASGTGSTGTATASASGGTAPYTYAWTGARTGASLTGLAPGTYTVTATDVNGCKSTKSVIVENHTGLESLKDILLFEARPTLSDGHFTLHLDLKSEQNMRLETYNMMGQMIDNQMIRGKNIIESMDWSHLSAGKYKLKLHTAEGFATCWIVIAK
jgi:Reeler domain/SprB repeat